MAKTKNHSTDLDRIDWPDWPVARRLLEWPESRLGFLERDKMRVEEFQEGDKLVIRAEMPGIDPDKDVEITVSDHTLRVSAERRQESTTEDKRGYRSEFSYGSFVRTLSLPAGATSDNVSATYKDGILEISVPIDHEQAGVSKIPVARK